MIDKPIIFAENLGRWIKYDIKNVCHHFTVRHDDYPIRQWYEKGVYYDFDLIIYHNKSTNKQAIILSFYGIKGKVMGCPDCATTKLWLVMQHNNSSLEEELRKVFATVVSQIPQVVIDKFVKLLHKTYGFTLYKPEEVEEI